MGLQDTLLWLGVQCLGFLLVGAVTSLLTRALRLRTQAWPFPRPRAAAGWGLSAILAGSLLVSVLFVAVIPPGAGPQQPMNVRSYGPGDVARQAAIALILLGPALLAMRRRGEPWASAGVSRHNLGGALIVGTLLALLSVLSVFFGGEGGPGEVLTSLEGRHFWALLQYIAVGFGEELAFRGYVQTRLVAWLGRWQGWVLASVLMALAHVVQRLTVGGMAPLAALLSAATLIPISLFLGYVMLRTENVVAPGLAHTFADWVGTLG